MPIALRDTYAKVTWDLASKRLDINSWGKKNDTGRGIAVTIAQNGVVMTPTTETLRMSFIKPDGTDGYIQATLADGKFYIETMSQVFAIVGVVHADFEITIGAEFIRSSSFIITVLDAQQSSTIISSNDYTALQAAIADIDQVKSDLAETMNKTAVTLSHQFADNTARDAYFVANPTELVEQVFIKVGTAYQQYLNSAWAASSPVLVEAVNQIDDASLLTTKTWSASKINTTKADKLMATNIATNGDFGNGTTGWNGFNSTYSVVDGAFNLLVNAQYGTASMAVPFTVDMRGHKIYCKAKVKSDYTNALLALVDVAQSFVAHNGSGQYENLSLVRTIDMTATSLIVRLQDTKSADRTTIYVDDVIVIDLTDCFGAGNEPTVTQMDKLIAEFPNAWFSGTSEILPIKLVASLSMIQSPQVAPTLLNGRSGTLTYDYSNSGLISLKGTASGGTLNTDIIVLRSGHRPSTTLTFPIVANGAFGIVTVNSSGQVRQVAGSVTNVYLDGIVFKAVQ